MRDTRKPEKPSPALALAGFRTCEAEAHTGISLCPLELLSVGRPQLLSLSGLSAPCSSLPEGKPQYQGLEILLVPWRWTEQSALGSEFSLSLALV